MAHWGASPESGILRKNKPKDNHDDLLVFGYACKLFRDDEKALYIDKGKHLIPWMGDDKLKIDRYDCRGALSDLAPYEASREGFDAMRWLGLNDPERKLEQLCDKERYHSLHINEEEEQMYKEEEQKRQKANEFQYSYDVPANPEQEAAPTVPEAEEEDEEYVSSPSLDVPVDVQIPKTVKENARIEKTALFVCKQGPQMEILIKAKQADNPQFGFLNQGHTLYKYYRHVLSSIKSGRYQVASKTKSEEKRDNSAESSQSDDHYLHPSLLSASTQSDVQTSSIPTIPYKPSANCSYSQLVNRIQGSQPEAQAEPPKTSEVFAQMTSEQQQYYQYYYAAQYYEYYKQLAQYQQGNGQPDQTVQPPDTQLEPSVQNYIQQMAYAQYVQHQQAANTNPYAQIVSNVSKDIPNPYTALLTNLQQRLSADQVGQSGVVKETPAAAYGSTGDEIRVVVQVAKPEETTTPPPAQGRIQLGPSYGLAPAPKPPDDAKKTLLLSLAQYGSDSEEDDESDKEPEAKPAPVPNGETQVVIDKMASYVAKNGEQFEEIVRAKGDPRFEFLNDGHEYNRYYRNRIREHKTAEERPTEKREIRVVPAAPPPRPKEKKVIAPVSFSIKKPKDDGPKDIKSALPVEESDDEEDPKSEQPQSQAADSVAPKEAEPCVNPTSEPSQKNNGILDADDPILEMIDLTDDIEERKDARRAEDKIKDKLAAAAREKLASVARDRALQLERKRKAAAFLKLKSAETVDKSDPAETPAEPEKDGKRSRSKSKEKKSKDAAQAKSSEDEDDKRKRSSKRKKSSHKRKHSKSKHDSRSKKKSKKKRRRSESGSSSASKSS